MRRVILNAHFIDTVIRKYYNVGLKKIYICICLANISLYIQRQTCEDSIAIASFPIDIHSPSGDGLTFYEQDRCKSYEIPFRVMIPKEIKGLMSPADVLAPPRKPMPLCGYRHR